MGYRLVSHENMGIHKAIFDHVLQKATKRICIASSTLKDFRVSTKNHQIRLFSNFLTRVCNVGVRIQLLTTPSMLNLIFVQRLSPEIEVRACARNHLKMICADDRVLYIGSGNMTPSAVGLRSPRRRNFEIGVLTTDTLSVKYALNIFEAIWNCVYCPHCRYLIRNDVECRMK